MPQSRAACQQAVYTAGRVVVLQSSEIQNQGPAGGRRVRAMQNEEVR